MCFVHTLSATESEEGEQAKERAEREVRGESREYSGERVCGLGQE